MAALIGIGTIVVTTMGRPDDTIRPELQLRSWWSSRHWSPHDAWRQPILRLVDTAVGVGRQCCGGVARRPRSGADQTNQAGQSP